MHGAERPRFGGERGEKLALPVVKDHVEPIDPVPSRSFKQRWKYSTFTGFCKNFARAERGWFANGMLRAQEFLRHFRLNVRQRS